jgi:dTDP-4-dehydrorhamnose reductase
MTFSSNLVFDGRAERPYTEDDVPNPLNVYGATQAEAERRVLMVLPQALLIRTSACFDAAGPQSFLDRLLLTLDGGATFEAASDVVVSPTYVPDLVNVSLDLLIDSAHGVWHLANQGATTWFEFARMAAHRAGKNPGLVAAVEMQESPSRAARPAFGALASRRGRLLRPLDAALDAWIQVRGTGADVKGEARCVSS